MPSFGARRAISAVLVALALGSQIMGMGMRDAEPNGSGNVTIIGHACKNEDPTALGAVANLLGVRDYFITDAYKSSDASERLITRRGITKQTSGRHRSRDGKRLVGWHDHVSLSVRPHCDLAIISLPMLQVFATIITNDYSSRCLSCVHERKESLVNIVPARSFRRAYPLGGKNQIRAQLGGGSFSRNSHLFSGGIGVPSGYSQGLIGIVSSVRGEFHRLTGIIEGPEQAERSQRSEKERPLDPFGALAAPSAAFH